MTSIVGAAGGGNWTSGGSWVGGVAPTSADDALLTIASGNITINTGSVCRSLDCTGYTGTLTHTAGVTLSIGDSGAPANNSNLKLVVGMTYTLGNASTSAISFISTNSTLQAITTGGRTLGNVTLNGGTGTDQFQDTFTCATMKHTNGVLDTNGQTFTWANYDTTASGTKTLSLGASAGTITGAGVAWNIGNGTSVNVNTATITFTGVGVTMQKSISGSFGFNGGSVVFTGGGATTITSTVANTNTFTLANLTVAPSSPAALDAFTFGVNVSCSGTFTATGSTTFYLAGGTGATGTAQTLTAAVASLTNVSFRDFTFAGAATWSGTLIGDAGGNTGLTATTPATQTYAGGTANWSNPAKWTSRRPLVQDNVIVNTAGGTLTADVSRLCGSADFTGYTGTLTLVATTSFYGSLTLGSGMTVSGAFTMQMLGRGSFTIKANGVATPAGVTINVVTGTYTLQAALTVGSGTTGNFVLTSGTFDASTFNVSANNLSFVSGATVKLGTGQWTARGAAAGSWSMNAGAIVVAGTSTIKMSWTSSSGTFAGGGKTYATLAFTATGTGALVITGSNTFAALDLECTTAKTITFPAGGSQTVTGTLTLKGATGQLLSGVSSSPGTQTTLFAGSVVNTLTNLSSDIAISNPVTDWSFNRNDVSNLAYAKAIHQGYVPGEATRLKNALIGNG